MGFRLRNCSLRCLSQNSVKKLYLKLLATLFDASIEKGVNFPKVETLPNGNGGTDWTQEKFT